MRGPAGGARLKGEERYWARTTVRGSERGAVFQAKAPVVVREAKRWCTPGVHGLQLVGIVAKTQSHHDHSYSTFLDHRPIR